MPAEDIQVKKKIRIIRCRFPYLWLHHGVNIFNAHICKALVVSKRKSYKEQRTKEKI